MGKLGSKEFIFDYEAQKTLALTTPSDDDFALVNLILDFDLIPYRDDNQIEHEVFDNSAEAVFRVGSLKFKKDAVDALKALPGWRSSEPTNHGHQIKRLTMRRDNILHLQQSRDQLALGPSKLLRDALAEIEKQIAARSLPAGKPKAGGKLQVPPGTSWDKITIKIIGGGLKAEIETPSGTNRLAYSELGFGDQRGSGEPTKRWLLLVRFATQKSVRPSAEKKLLFRKRVSDLSKDLKMIFGIHDNPFSHNNKTGHSPKFNLLDRTDQKLFKEQASANDRDDNDIGAVFQETIKDRSAVARANSARKKVP